MADNSHADLDLLFERRNSHGYRVRVMSSPVDEGTLDAPFEPPLSDLEIENFLLKTTGARGRSRLAGDPNTEMLRTLGGKLFDALFQGRVRECLRNSVDHAARQGERLRIRLRLDECGELARLPWELLYDTEDQSFLALSDQTPVVRYLHAHRPLKPLTVTLPLRMLVVVSSPEDLVALDVEAERTKIDEALKGLTRQAIADVRHLDNADLESLQDVLLTDEYHILHFVGHGSYDMNSGGALMFTDEHGRSRRVSADDLAVQLRDRTSLRLVVLNACEGATGDPDDRFSAVADNLVLRGIPAVVAMRSEISDLAAVRFATAFYLAVAVGRPIDAAVAEGRKRIQSVSPLEWATPVLYLRSGSAHLFDISGSAVPEPVVTRVGPRMPTVGSRSSAPPAATESVRTVDTRPSVEAPPLVETMPLVETLPSVGACEHVAMGPVPSGLLAAACKDRAIRVLNVFNGRLVSECWAPDVARPLRLAWGRWPRNVASSHVDDRVVIWDLEAEAPACVIHVGSCPVNAIALSHDGRRLAVTCGSRIVIYDTRGRAIVDLSPRERGKRRWATASLDHVSFTPRDRYLIVGGSDGIVRQLDTDGRVTMELRHPEAITAMAVAPDQLATGSADGRLRLWSWDGVCQHHSRRDGPVAHLAYSADNTLFAATSADRQVLVHDRSGAVVARTELRGRAVGVVFHPDGDSLITATSDGTLERRLLPSAVQQDRTSGTGRREES